MNIKPNWKSRMETNLPGINAVRMALVGATFLFANIPSGSAEPKADPAHFPAEAVQLKRAYEQDVEKAVQPIRDRYMADLKRLLADEIQEGNKVQADAIKEELDGLPGGSGISGDTIAEFESKLVGVGWNWGASHLVGFDWGGKSVGDLKELTWKTVSPYVIKYETPDGASGTVTFDRDLQNGTVQETTPDGVQRAFTIVRLPPDRRF